MKKQIKITNQDLQPESLRPGFYDKDQRKCYGCIHRGEVPGSCHSSCNNHFAIITAEKHGINNGWVVFPFNFDPVWLNSCDSYVSKNEKQELAKLTNDELIKKIYCEINYIKLKFDALQRGKKITLIAQKKCDRFCEIGQEINIQKIDDYSKEELIDFVYDLMVL